MVSINSVCSVDAIRQEMKRWDIAARCKKSNSVRVVPGRGEVGSHVGHARSNCHRVRKTDLLPPRTGLICECRSCETCPCVAPQVTYGKENGTGLGLAVVQKIVQDHGGEISVERTPDARTVFQIVLPGRLMEDFHGADENSLGVPSLVPAKRAADASNNSIRRPGA